MLSELERIIELGKLIGQRTNGAVNVTVDINTWTVFETVSVSVWIFFFDEEMKIKASYHYDDKPYTLNILTMMFNEVRAK